MFVTLRCLIVDDNVGFLRASRVLLEGEGVAVVGVATTAAEGLRIATEQKPDVVLVDIDLGEDSGCDVARRLASTLDGSVPDVIVISAYHEEDFADLIAECGAAGFLPKSDLSMRAIQAILSRPAPDDGDGR